MILEFLASWLAETVLTESVKLTAGSIHQHVRDFRGNPKRYGWDKKLTERDERILDALQSTIPSTWKRVFLHGPLLAKQSIAIWGPSGTGKTLIASRLAGVLPKYAPPSSTKMEHEKIVAGWRGLNILTAPGSKEQDEEGAIAKLKNSLVSATPPKIFCFVVAGGYHATAAQSLTKTFRRPGSEGEDVAEDIEGYRETCFKEEIDMLTEIRQHCSGKMKARVPVFLTVVNKRDLWGAMDHPERILARYQSRRSSYGKIVAEICKSWGLGLSPATHEVYPAYSFAGGFHPDNSIRSRALTAEDSEADAMLLRALIYYHYSDGVGV
jgi:hypothetical protein